MRVSHYQQAPHREAEPLPCVTGKMFNVVVDLGRESSTFLRSEIRVLDTVDCRRVHVPRGCASANVAPEEGTIMRCHMSERYVPGAAKGFRYYGFTFGIVSAAHP
jgi:dTDP-4-dehydrorhamnose 3,5-epimerase